MLLLIPSWLEITSGGYFVLVCVLMTKSIRRSSAIGAHPIPSALYNRFIPLAAFIDHGQSIKCVMIACKRIIFISPHWRGPINEGGDCMVHLIGTLVLDRFPPVRLWRWSSIWGREEGGERAELVEAARALYHLLWSGRNSCTSVNWFNLGLGHECRQLRRYYSNEAFDWFNRVVVGI